MDNKIFYVYEWFNVDTDEVFYVGKGKGVRYKTIKGRNSYFSNYYGKYSCDVRKIKEKLSEDEAYDLEEKMISHYKEIGQCKCNFHKGGSGGRYKTKFKGDTKSLATMQSYIARSFNKNEKLNLKEHEEQFLNITLREFGLICPEDYFDLTREDKLKFYDLFYGMIIEYEHDMYLINSDDLCGCSSLDEYWEHIYKY